jgi:hypothetical protein
LDLIKLYTSIIPLIAAPYGSKTCDVHPICRYINRTPTSRGIDYSSIPVFPGQIYCFIYNHILIICSAIYENRIPITCPTYTAIYRRRVVPRSRAHVPYVGRAYDLRLGGDETQKSCGDYQTHDFNRGQSFVRINPPLPKPLCLFIVLLSYTLFAF